MARRLQYSEEQMQNALQAVADGMKVSTASKFYSVPKTTLLYKSTGVYPKERKIGPDTVLTKEEEQLLVKWILHVGDIGFPVTKTQLLDSVEILVKKLKRPNMFTNGRPGRHWYEAFLRRHPELRLRTSQNLTHSRASVSEQNIREWFLNVRNYFVEKNLITALEDSSRVFNLDETAFFLSPKEDKVIVRKGEKAVYNFINNDEKECLTTLICGNAQGMLAPPMVMFSYQRIPNRVVGNMPPDWAVGRSENGWMTGESFYEYIANIFHPWLLKNNISLPVILFVDGHSSHLTMALSNFCVENQIELVALLPNSTHILQPLDVAVFRSLKRAWKTAVHNWRVEHNGGRLTREHFGTLLRKAIEEVDFKQILPNGFRACGLLPFNPDNINYNKVIKSQDQKQETEKDTASENLDLIRKHLKFFETRMKEETLSSFKNSSQIWTGKQEDTSLFYYWHELKMLASKARETTATPVEANTIEIEPGDDVEWLSQLLGENESVELLFVDNSDVLQTVTESTISNNSNTSEQDIDKGAHANHVILPDVNESAANVRENTESSSQEIEQVPEQTGSHTPAKTSPNQKIEQIPEQTGSHTPVKTSPNLLDNTASSSSSKVDGKNPQTPSSAPTDVPSPFKSSLFWPSLKLNTSKTKPKLPSVATSESWRLYHMKKEDQKQRALQEKEERKRKREEKSAEKTQTKKAQKKKKDEEDYESKQDNGDNRDDGDKENEEQNNVDDQINQDDDIKEDSYVVVCYDDSYYPGKILEIDTDDIKIKTMVKSGLHGWKWPISDDIIWYKRDDIVEIIRKPSTTMNKRGVFDIPEMKKY